MSAIDAVIAAIKAFDFEDYGLHEVDPTSEYAEWVPVLAAAVHAAARPEVLAEAAAVADRFTERWPDMDAMKADGVIGPFTAFGRLADELREMAGKDTGGQPAGESTQPAQDADTDASSAFMLLGTTPSLAGLRAELHIEGHPPIVGRYCGFGSRRLEPGVLLIEPALLFRWSTEDSAEGTVPAATPALNPGLAAYSAAGTCACRAYPAAHRADLHDEHGQVRDIVQETAANWAALVHARCARCGWTSRQTWLREEFTTGPVQSYIASHRDQLTGACVAPEGEVSRG